MLELAVTSAKDTKDFGARVGKALKGSEIIGLSGPLGSGKTTLVRGLVQGLSIDPKFLVSSPTYIYAQTYPGRLPLHHIDAYRVENEAHFLDLGLDEFFREDAVTVIEWVERVEKAIGRVSLRIDLRFGEGNNRFIHLSGEEDIARKVIGGLKGSP